MNKMDVECRSVELHRNRRCPLCFAPFAHSVMISKHPSGAGCVPGTVLGPGDVILAKERLSQRIRNVQRHASLYQQEQQKCQVATCTKVG